jgi:hypothetical protein
MKTTLFTLSVLFFVNSVVGQLYVKNGSCIFDKGTVVYAKGNLELDMNSNFYLRNEGQFLQGTLGASANKGISNFLFSGRNRKQFAYNYWCFPVGNAPAGSGNEDFGITMHNTTRTNILSYMFCTAA